MHFDPYESRLSKRRRIISNVGIIIILGAMLAGIISLFSHSGKVKRHEFDKLESIELAASDVNSGINEFAVLYDTLSDSEHIVLGNNFKEKFPLTHSLLSLDGTAYEHSDAVYPELNESESLTDIPFVQICGGYIVIAQSVVSTENDCRDLLVISYKAETVSDDNTVGINLSDYNCYTVRYNTRNPSLPLKLLIGKQSAVLDLYKIKFSAVGVNPTCAQYNLTLNYPFEPNRAREKLYHHIIFDPINNSYGTAEIIKNEKTTNLILKQEKNALVNNDNELSYEIMLSDDNINLIKEVSLNFNFEGADNRIKITFN